MPKSVQKKQNEFTILTVPEVTKYLCVSDTKVYQLIKEGDLPVVQIRRA